MITAVYPAAFEHLFRGRYGDLLTADVRLMLCDDWYTPAATDAYADIPGTAEAYGGGYTSGGAPIPGLTLAWDASIGREVLGCGTIVFPAAAFTVRYAIAYVAIGGDYMASPLICYADLGQAVTLNNADWPIAFPAGLLRLGPPA